MTPSIEKESTHSSIDLRPRTLKEAMRFAEIIASSDLCPKDLDKKNIKEKTNEIFLRIVFGADVGLSAMQSVGNVMTANGKCSLYGDALLAVVQKSPAYEWHTIEEIGTKYQDDWGFKCTVKRKGAGQLPYTVIFTKADAVKAKLWDKPYSQWATYPQRMLKFKAIGYALRDMFAAETKGFIAYEEAIDYTTEQAITPHHEGMVDVTPAMQTIARDESVTEDGEVVAEFNVTDNTQDATLSVEDTKNDN